MFQARLPAEVDAELRPAVWPGWWRAAACAHADPVLFDTELASSRELRTARGICAGCPVRNACLASALLRFEHGLWAGTTEADRAAARTDLRRGVLLSAVRDRYTPATAGGALLTLPGAELAAAGRQQARTGCASHANRHHPIERQRRAGAGHAHTDAGRDRGATR
jgi:hypothetical protein